LENETLEAKLASETTTTMADARNMPIFIFAAKLMSRSLGSKELSWDDMATD